MKQSDASPSLNDPAEQKKQAWITSLRLLAATPKTRKVLQEKLTEKGYADDVIEETLKALESRSLLDDGVFAKNVVRRLTQDKPSGKHKISYELKRKGITSNLREQLLSELDPEDEQKRAYDLALMNWEKWGSLTAQKRIKRTYDYLIRRGFDFETSRDVVEQLKKGTHEN